MKKIIRYMQDTAVSYSNDRYNSAYYLGARGKEPQQHQHRHPHQNNTARTLSYQHQYYHQQYREKGRDIDMAHGDVPPPAYTRGTHGIPGGTQRFQYASDNVLQSVEVYIPESHSCSNGSTKIASDHRYHQQHTKSNLSDPPKYWILFIHGGYFRDPLVTSSSFHPTLSLLLSPSSPNPRIREIQPHIAGYASINYRLSPHEGYPQDDDVPTYEKREAKWPEQMTDVLRAIAWLQSKFNFGERYLLVGHSVGATMALRACLSSGEASDEDDGISATHSITPPLAVLGVCGIYNFPALHAHWGEGYEYLTRNAGLTPQTWREASPALHSKEEFERKWVMRGKEGKKKRWCLLAASNCDGLVEWGQVEAMNAVFDGGKLESGMSQVLHDVIEIKGKHNEIWEKGEELARCIASGVGEMMGLDQ